MQLPIQSSQGYTVAQNTRGTSPTPGPRPLMTARCCQLHLITLNMIVGTCLSYMLVRNIMILAFHL